MYLPHSLEDNGRILDRNVLDMFGEQQDQHTLLLLSLEKLMEKRPLNVGLIDHAEVSMFHSK